MERRSLFCRDVIKGFSLLTDVFFLLFEHIEIMQIIINCQAKNGGSMIWWRWADCSLISYSVSVLNTSQCKVLLWFEVCPTFLLSYQGRTCETAPSKHLLTHVHICINIHRLTYLPTLDPLETKHFNKKQQKGKIKNTKDNVQ